MTSALRAAFETQAWTCEELGSPFMGRLCRLFASRLTGGNAVSDRLLAWQGDIGAGAQSVPLRTAGALHALVLDGSDPALAAAYPPHAVSDDVLWDAIISAFASHTDRILHWLTSPPQTNEVRRAAAMITAACILRKRYDLPLVVSELGASAGLNLRFDRFRLETPGGVLGAADSTVILRPDWQGAVPPDAPVEIADARGVDLNPVNPHDPDGALRLMAYLWPDQPDRLDLTRAAIALAGPSPDQGDAAAWLEARLATPKPGHLHLIYHTIAWQYFPPETQDRCTIALARAGAEARPDAPIARLSMEGDETPGSAALTIEIWDGSGPKAQKLPLGRIDYHGRFLNLGWA